MSLVSEGKINMKEVVRKKDTGNFLIRYWKSFKHAVDGIVYAIENEHNILIMMLYRLKLHQICCILKKG